MEAVVETELLASRTFSQSLEDDIERSTYNWYDFLLDLEWKGDEA